jgi:hypothetical protein
MSVKAGVWIDHKQAILVLVSEVGKEIKKIKSGIEGPVRSRSNNAYSPNDYVPEDRLERKFDSHLKSFFDEVISHIQGAEAVLILGPGEAKGEFQKRLQRKKTRGPVVESEPADKMTDRQLAAKVTEHFAVASAKRHVPQKKTIKNLAAKTTAARPKKKSRK